MFGRLDKFDGPIFGVSIYGGQGRGGGGGWMAFIWHVNWITYLGGNFC